jgi:hypothetical protein
MAKPTAEAMEGALFDIASLTGCESKPWSNLEADFLAGRSTPTAIREAVMLPLFQYQPTGPASALMSWNISVTRLALGGRRAVIMYSKRFGVDIPS